MQGCLLASSSILLIYLAFAVCPNGICARSFVHRNRTAILWRIASISLLEKGVDPFAKAFDKRFIPQRACFNAMSCLHCLQTCLIFTTSACHTWHNASHNGKCQNQFLRTTRTQAMYITSKQEPSIACPGMIKSLSCCWIVRLLYMLHHIALSDPVSQRQKGSPQSICRGSASHSLRLFL